MKKCVLFLLALLFVFSLVGCGSNETTDDSAKIESISVSSLPKMYDYRFTDQKSIKKIMEYFDGLHLITDFSENPNEYCGMNWVIEISYADGSSKEIVHSGNMFIRFDGGALYKMTYEEASRFDILIDELREKVQSGFYFNGKELDGASVLLFDGPADGVAQGMTPEEIVQSVNIPYTTLDEAGKLEMIAGPDCTVEFVGVFLESGKKTGYTENTLSYMTRGTYVLMLRSFDQSADRGEYILVGVRTTEQFFAE